MLSNLPDGVTQRDIDRAYGFSEEPEREERPKSLYILFLKVLREEGEEEALELARDLIAEIQLPYDYEQELIEWAMDS